MAKSMFVHTVHVAHGRACHAISITSRGELSGAALHCAPERSDCRLLSVKHARIEDQIFILRTPNEERARHITSIPSNLRAKVEEGNLPFSERSTSRVPVRECGIWTGECSDIKCERLGSAFAHLALQ
jgi:hypothetical protein